LVENEGSDTCCLSSDMIDFRTQISSLALTLI